MAITNSISLGKARGKLGNVIFQTYFGRTIVRSLNTSISGDPSDSQVAARLRVANGSRSWNVLQSFLAYWKPLSCDNLSIYNCYVKFLNKYFTSNYPVKGFQAIRELSEANEGRSRIINITSIKKLLPEDMPMGLQINFETLAFQNEYDITLYILAQQIINPQSPSPTVIQIIRDVQISNTDWGNGYVWVEFEDIDIEFAIVYGRQANSYSDNILFSANPIEIQ